MLIDKLNETLADAVMNRPREFFINSRRYCLWSPSLGVSMLLERHFAALEIDNGVMSGNPSIEALRIVTKKRSEVCHLLAIATFRQFDDLSNSTLISERANFFSDSLSDSEIARLLLIVLARPNVETLLVESGIQEQQRKQAELPSMKNKDGHTVVFGGKTIYGLLIDAACRAYGWTKEYVVWGIDLLSLRLMLADTVSTVYLTDEDRKALGRNLQSSRRYGMTPEDIAALKAMDWS